MSPGAPVDGHGDATRVLRSLLDAAEDSTERLEQLLARSAQGDAGATRASVRLQERLRLGAEMLRAFQTQIERLEASESQLERRLAAARHASETLAVEAGTTERRHRLRLRTGRRRIGQLVRAAVNRIARRLDDREIALREREQAVTWQATRLETAIASARRLEQRLEDLTHRAEAAARDTETGALRLRELMHLYHDLVKPSPPPASDDESARGQATRAPAS